MSAPRLRSRAAAPLASPASAFRRRDYPCSVASRPALASACRRRKHYNHGTSTTAIGSRRSPRRSTTTASSSRTLMAWAVAFLCFLSTRRRAFADALDTISVATPTAALEAGAAFSVEWDYSTDSDVSGTTGDLNPFGIELRSCGDNGEGCGSGSCGSIYRVLCERNGGCMDSDGSYDVVIPSDVSTGDYVIRVSYLGSSAWTTASSSGSGLYGSSSSSSAAVTACSDIFSVEGKSSSSLSSASDGSPKLEAITPDAALEVGEAFTAHWVYDDGEGEGGGTFEVNLHSCANGSCADGGCGTFVAALCETPGCYDPGMGDYDVRVPVSVSPGQFKLKVVVGATDTATCTTASFGVVSGDTTDTPSPTPSLAGPTSQPAAVPTSQPVARPTSQPAAAPSLQPAAAPTIQPVSASSAPTTGLGSPGTPPTPVPARNTCSSAAVLKYSYTVESSGMPLITVSHESEDRDEGGCASLTGVWEWLATGPTDVPTDLLYPADPDSGEANTSSAVATGTWLLRTSIDVTNGVLFEVKGTDAVGGDCDKLLLSSSTDLYIRLRGAGGHLYIYKTHITSWSEAALTQHELGDGSDGSTPRSFIACLSEILEADQTCDGVAKKERGECRMDIIDSELGYLGYATTESYGITWKVRGLCQDLSNADTLFESVRVYGDLQGSDVHHMWYGMYSYGHLGGVWTNNLMHDNHVYGFDPHDDSDYLTITGNSCYNNGNHGIIASKRCDHLLVKDNISFDNLGSGIMLHVACDDSIVTGNDLYSNDAGLSLVETSRTSVTDNKFTENKWGVRVLVGANDNTIENNEFEGNTNHDILQYIGSDTDTPTVEPLTGFNERNTYDNNVIITSVKFSVDLEDSLETVISNNEFSGTSTFSFIRTNGTRLSGNTGDPASADPYVEASCFTENSGATPVCSR